MRIITRPVPGVSANNAYFPRLLGVFLDDSASSYYRIVLPMKLLADQGYPVGWGHIDQLDQISLDKYDAVVVSRTGTGDPSQIVSAFAGLQKEGKAIFLDYDDNVLAIPEWNPGYLKDVSGIKAALGAAQGVVVTNTALASAFKPYVKQVEVAPNAVDPRLWPQDTPRITDKLTIGLTGSPSHIEDWRQIAAPMRRIREEFPSVEFLVAGFLPDYLDGVASIYIPWVSLLEYPYLVNNIDIGLCPLIDDVFNAGKSPIKAYELGLAGAAVVASPTQYGSVVRGKGTIARTEEEWYEGIKRYIIDTYYRKTHARLLKGYVEDRANIGRQGRYLVDMYRRMYGRAIQGGIRVATV